MRHFLKIITASLFCLLLVNCSDEILGKDGEDGAVYISYDWAFPLLRLYTDDPAIAFPLQRGEYFKAKPGIYNLYYVTSYDGSAYNMTYKIYANKGEKAYNEFDGENGSDIYFDITLYHNGPSLYALSKPRDPNNDDENIFYGNP